MSIKRRHFLQFTGSTVASFGLSQFIFQRQANSYGKVLGKGNGQKIALLVGIDKYPGEARLNGCVKDVELQKQLLIHRFGFPEKNIHTLVDEQATRGGILDAFEKYLIEQTNPGDTVVFHYSGHGSLVYDPEPITKESNKIFGYNGSLVPIDSPIPLGRRENTSMEGAVKDIMGHTLFLLMSAVPSQNFTAVLDSCHSGGATRNDSVRAIYRDEKKYYISSEEKKYQQKLLKRLNLSHDKFVEAYRKGIGNGVVIAACQDYQSSYETNLVQENEKAGLFTYNLTRYLWKQSNNLEAGIAEITTQMKEERTNQIPLFETKSGSGYEKQPIYLVNPQIPPADAVITEVKGNKVQLWLGGVDLENIKKGSTFAVIDRNGKSLSNKVTLTVWQGIQGEGTVQSGVITLGSLLQLLK